MTEEGRNAAETQVHTGIGDEMGFVGSAAQKSPGKSAESQRLPDKVTNRKGGKGMTRLTNQKLRNLQNNPSRVGNKRIKRGTRGWRAARC